MVGRREESLELQPTNEDERVTTETLRRILCEKYPRAAQYLKDITIAINLEYVAEGDVREIAHGDEVALIPPISGG
ncbi:hypothetical protein DYB32_008858 [Aphanomyces invadans]|nr:hypothetical protein DYB32_008858 [Aphanomyces invadans]